MSWQLRQDRSCRQPLSLTTPPPMPLLLCSTLLRPLPVCPCSAASQWISIYCTSGVCRQVLHARKLQYPCQAIRLYVALYTHIRFENTLSLHVKHELTKKVEVIPQAPQPR